MRLSPQAYDFGPRNTHATGCLKRQRKVEKDPSLAVFGRPWRRRRPSRQFPWLGSASRDELTILVGGIRSNSVRKLGPEESEFGEVSHMIAVGGFLHDAGHLARVSLLLLASNNSKRRLVGAELFHPHRQRKRRSHGY